MSAVRAFRLSSLWLALAALVSLAGVQPMLAQGRTRVASVEGITEYVLDNGLRVLLFPDQSKPNTRPTVKRAWRTCWNI
jgi:zinc protease